MKFNIQKENGDVNTPPFKLFCFGTVISLDSQQYIY
jgi:hypothetical protein